VKICIYGAGAIGGYLAAGLSEVDGVELSQCDGVSALTACGDGAVPVLFDRARRRQWPAPRVRTEGCVGHGVHGLGTLSTVKITSSLFKITTARPRY